MVVLGQEANESVGVVWWSSMHSSPLVHGVPNWGNAFLSTITTVFTSTHFKPVERLLIPEDFTSFPKSLEGIKSSLLYFDSSLAICWYSIYQVIFKLFACPPAPPTHTRTCAHTHTHTCTHTHTHVHTLPDDAALHIRQTESHSWNYKCSLHSLRDSELWLPLCNSG